MEKNTDNTPTRQELHELVWKLPMKKAAARFSVPARTLSTICRQNDIPVPSSGHWSKVKSGRLVPATPLPHPENDKSVLVVRHRRGGSNGRPSQEKAKRRSGWALGSGSLEDYQPKSFYVGTLKADIQQAIRGGHTVIHTYDRTAFRISILPGSAARTVRLLDQVCMLAHTYSMDIRPSDNGLAFSKGNYDVPLAITEQVGSDRVSEARLEIRLDDGHYNDGIQRRFADTRSTSLEEQISLVAKSLVCSAEAGAKRLGITAVSDLETAVTGSLFESDRVLEHTPCRLSARLADLETAARRCRLELIRQSEIKTNRSQGPRRQSNAY